MPSVQHSVRVTRRFGAGVTKSLVASKCDAEPRYGGLDGFGRSGR